MCGGCVKEYIGQLGCPPDASLLTDDQRTLARMIGRFYRRNPTGGEWHIHLDDYNVDCDMALIDAQSPLATRIALRYNAMTEPERMGAVALAHGNYEGSPCLTYSPKRERRRQRIWRLKRLRHSHNWFGTTRWRLHTGQWEPAVGVPDDVRVGDLIESTWPRKNRVRIAAIEGRTSYRVPRWLPRRFWNDGRIVTRWLRERSYS